MLFWILLFGIPVVLAVALRKSDDFWFDFLGLTAVAYVISGLVFLGLLGISSSITNKHFVYETQSLRALQVSNTGLHGSFFLGIGSLGNDTVFYYYSGQGNRFQLKHVYPEDATFVVSSDTKVVKKQTCYASPGWAAPWTWSGCFDTKYTFYVPQQSITNKISVGLPQ